jgi:hypothetical protein
MSCFPGGACPAAAGLFCITRVFKGRAGRAGQCGVTPLAVKREGHGVRERSVKALARRAGSQGIGAVRSIAESPYAAEVCLIG